MNEASKNYRNKIEETDKTKESIKSDQIEKNVI